ncbi:MAG TPA: hypothetical protein P5572_18660 [Phycisphaerae bacterium]|nr:hypothetical protein [Phycisphaerales bacterium]HRX87051.1 hypothetical protein [Phycisphaerae bacterium]
MSRKAIKGAVLVAMLGAVCQFSSCLTKGLLNAVNYTGLEFVLDNNQVFDLFTD